MAYVSQADKAKLAPAIRAVLAKYGMKGTISIRHHSTLVVTVKSGNIGFDTGYNTGYTGVNVYWIDQHYEGRARKFLNELHGKDEQCAYNMAAGETSGFMPITHDAYKGIIAVRQAVQGN